MKINEVEEGFKYPALVVPYQKQSKRDIAYPYVLACAIAIALIIASIVRVGGWDGIKSIH